MEEGTSRNVPIAGFEMILREDYKSRDEVEGTYNLPKYHFKPQDTGNIPVMLPTTKSPSVILYGSPITLPGFGIACRNLQNSVFFSSGGFPLSCAQYNAYPLYCAPQCNAYPLYCARNKQPVRGKGGQHYTDGDFWRREHHGMFLSPGFEMILREDYKSRDEVEGLIFFPKYHFKPQDTGNIPWCSRQQSRHLLYCMATHCLARLRHSSQKFTKLSIFFSGDFL